MLETLLSTEDVSLQGGKLGELFKGVRFFGEVPASDLFTGLELARAGALSSGVNQHLDEPWLHFELDGHELYVAKKPLRHSLSRSALATAGFYLEGREVVKGDRRFKVRLLTGIDGDQVTGTANGLNPTDTDKSEWNRLIYPIHDGRHTDPRNNTPRGFWGIYSDADLHLHQNYGPGSISWCHGSRSTYPVGRGGYSGLTYMYSNGDTSGSNTGWRPVLEEIPWGSPPEDTFLGEVSANDFIDGSVLAASTGVSEGVAHNNDVGWLKFLTREGKTLYVAKKSIRHTVSWDQLNSKGLVYGDSTVLIGGHTYKVRLLTGMDYNPIAITAGYDIPNSSDSEWSRLLYSVYSGIPYTYLTKTPPGYWPLYDHVDLGVQLGVGRQHWCQDTSTTRNQICVRGLHGVSYTGTVSKGTAVDHVGWRPVLELVE